MDKNLLNIALTGARFSGKSHVAEGFIQAGVPVFDADALIKYIINYKESMRLSVKKVFGSHFVFNEYINPFAFDSEKFSELINILEFDLFESYNRFRQRNKNKQYTIFHSSILFEKNWQNRFDRVICVFSPKIDRVNRYQVDTGSKVSDSWELLNNEIDDTIRNNMSDYIIHNYLDAPTLKSQINNIDTKITDYYLALTKKREVEDLLFNSQLHKNISF
jgi:dephospho-CoA kinase